MDYFVITYCHSLFLLLISANMLCLLVIFYISTCLMLSFVFFVLFCQFGVVFSLVICFISPHYYRIHHLIGQARGCFPSVFLQMQPYWFLDTPYPTLSPSHTHRDYSHQTAENPTGTLEISCSSCWKAVPMECSGKTWHPSTWLGQNCWAGKGNWRSSEACKVLRSGLKWNWQ